VRASWKSQAVSLSGRALNRRGSCSIPESVLRREGIQNCILINRLDQFSILDRPLGRPSRKSFIGKILGLPVEERLEGTIAASILAVQRGRRILRVHDVKEVKRGVEVATAIMEESHIPA